MNKQIAFAWTNCIFVEKKKKTFYSTSYWYTDYNIYTDIYIITHCETVTMEVSLGKMW